MDNYEVLADRVKSLLVRWDGFHSKHKDTAYTCMRGLLNEINDDFTQNLVEREKQVYKSGKQGNE